MYNEFILPSVIKNIEDRPSSQQRPRRSKMPSELIMEIIVLDGRENGHSHTGMAVSLIYPTVLCFFVYITDACKKQKTNKERGNFS